MRSRLVFLTLVSGLIVAISSSAHAQRGIGDSAGIARQGLQPELKTVIGKVVSVETGPCEKTTGRSLEGTHLLLKTDSGETLNVHLGPAAAVAETARQLKPGTTVKASVFRTDGLPAEHFVAQTLEFDSQTVQLRGDSLRPEWAGGSGPQAGRGRGAGPGPGPGAGRGAGREPGAQAGAGAGRGQGAGAGRGQGAGAGRGQGAGAGRGQGAGAGRGQGAGAGRGPGTQAGRGQGAGAGRGPETQAGRGPETQAGRGQGAGAGAGRGPGAGRGQGRGQTTRQDTATTPDTNSGRDQALNQAQRYRLLADLIEAKAAEKPDQDEINRLTRELACLCSQQPLAEPGSTGVGSETQPTQLQQPLAEPGSTGVGSETQLQQPLANQPPRPAGRGPGFGWRGGRGAAGPGPAGDAAFIQDRDMFHYLLEHREAIERSVKNIAEGVETVTESDDPEVAATIRRHVESMHQRLTEGRPIHMRDPLFAAVFGNSRKITMRVEPTSRGVRVVETSDDPYVARLIQAHAEVVNLFVANGFAEVHINHAVPPAEKPPAE